MIPDAQVLVCLLHFQGDPACVENGLINMLCLAAQVPAYLQSCQQCDASWGPLVLISIFRRSHDSTVLVRPCPAALRPGGSAGREDRAMNLKETRTELQPQHSPGNWKGLYSEVKGGL